MSSTLAAAAAGEQSEHRLPHPPTGGLGFLLYLPTEYENGADFPVIFHLREPTVTAPHRA